MHKHTPGPWTAEARHKTAINAGDKHVAMVNFWNHPDKAVCINEEEHQANVALISAAPDLLEALEKVIHADDWDQSGMHFLDATLRTTIDKAVAKAKGEHHDT